MEQGLTFSTYFAFYRFIAKNRILSSPEQQREIHFHTVMVLSTGILMWAYAIVALFTIASPIPGIVGVAASLVHGLSPFLFRTKLSIYTISNLAIGAGCAHQATFAYFTGGYHSSILIWLAILPLLSGIIAGVRGALTWMCVTLSVISAFLYAHFYGHQFPNLITKVGFEWSMGLILYGFVILNSTMIFLYVAMRTQTEKRLQEQSDKIDTLFRILFHDLANSLGRLNFGMTLLQRNESEDKKARGLSMSVEATETMLDITRNVKSMYAVSKGKTSLEYCPTSVLESISYIQRVFSEEIKKKNLMIATHIVGDSDLTVHVDPVNFKNQILANIFSNAIKFSPPGETIFVTAQRRGEWIEINVMDNGIGMPAHILKNLFDLSFKTSRLGTSGESGTGFGMIIMKSFVELFGGRVSVASKEKTEQDPRSGTTFTLELKIG